MDEFERAESGYPGSDSSPVSGLGVGTSSSDAINRVPSVEIPPDPSYVVSTMEYHLGEVQ